MEELIKQNQNVNGGGLAISITGRFESNRNALARYDVDKRTAGEVAKSLRKAGYSIYAKEVKQVCEEWHHAGALPKEFGRRMAKTYYTRKTDNTVLSELKALQEKCEKEHIERELSPTVFTLSWSWSKDGKRWAKEAIFETQKKVDVSDKTSIISQEQYNEFKHNQGMLFYGWEEPSLDKMKSLSCLKKEREEQKRLNRNAKRRLTYAAKKQQLKQEEQRNKINVLVNEGVDNEDNLLLQFFTNELHPAPKQIFDIKERLGISWNQLRKQYKKE
ncbi:hypothetical protein [Flavobacterium sp. ASW18X]|uniref:hypothetical protein n=1 Tax=Flavobacterium sp. ASW18X TaxID=2572595 RepID=UPI0010AEB149|nr:hypothetical protein [Flavobacterium sp. ASW18X]TKD58986.1 hypothetical protein FBT53_14475 [Flavobacterium sp. ASW18X]